MIKISSGRKGVECSFGEDNSVVSVLGGKGDFRLLSGDGEFGRYSGFSNMFIVK